MKHIACILSILPSNPDVRECFLVSIKKSIVVSNYTRICSLNFIGGEKTIDNSIPMEFCSEIPKQPRNCYNMPNSHSKIATCLLEPFACQPPSKKVKVGENDCDESEEKFKELAEEIATIKRERVDSFGLRGFHGSDNDFIKPSIHFSLRH